MLESKQCPVVRVEPLQAASRSIDLESAPMCLRATSSGSLFVSTVRAAEALGALEAPREKGVGLGRQ